MRIMCLFGWHKWHGTYHLKDEKMARVAIDCLRCFKHEEWDDEIDLLMSDMGIA